MRKRTMATILVLSLLLTLTAPALATKEELTAETLGYTPANELLSEDGDMLVTIDPAIKAALDRDYAYLQNENGSYSVKSLGDVNNLSLYASAVETADEFITEPLEIVDLSVLQFCTQLEYVFIDSRSISGLAALSNAKKVRSISLTSAQLNDLFNISSIPKLDSLRFTNCQIADYSDLSKCKALTNLTISDNELRDLSFVPQIKKLSMLDISGVPNADFSTLTDLKKLYGLIINMENAASGSLEWEIIGRCEGYVNLFNLTSLTKKDVESHLSTPYQLDFTYNEPPEAPIDLFAIQYAKSLDMLTFYKANIGDLSFIANCKKLNSLAFYGCVLQKSGHLWNAPKLVDLFIHNCKVNDPGLFFAGIARAKKLTSLIIDNANLGGTSALESIGTAAKVKFLSLVNCQLNNDLDFLSGNAYKSLSLGLNNITDFSALSNANQIIKLSLMDNPISDFAPLAGISGLKTLHLGKIITVPLPDLPKTNIVQTSDLWDSLYLKWIN